MYLEVRMIFQDMSTFFSFLQMYEKCKFMIIECGNFIFIIIISSTNWVWVVHTYMQVCIFFLLVSIKTSY